LKHASFFSGVGGLDLGFHRASIETVSVSEIDPYANAVLAERFPSAPNLGSITEVNANDIPEADIWSGGFPCQDLSVAGKRAGFAGKRSSLAFTFLDLVEQRRPRWLVLENVPGLFSSNGGADFGRLLYEMEQLRYGVSWRTLDARYFGVAQRRRRVFLIASLESDRAAEVLLECEGCSGILRRAGRRGKVLPPALQTALESLAQSEQVLQSAASAETEETHSLPAPSHDDSAKESTAPLMSPSSSVRRLTPTECERLMGWPDGWTITQSWTRRG
jgi:DNA (cytosine-5)-methyltransferase 1